MDVLTYLKPKNGFRINIFIAVCFESLLTHICPVEFSIVIKWTSPFPVLGMSGVLFHFYSIFDRNSC